MKCVLRVSIHFDDVTLITWWECRFCYIVVGLVGVGTTRPRGARLWSVLYQADCR